jgi:hypothetical protein
MGVVHMVARPKTLFKDALVGFALGLIVVSGLAIATWGSRTATTHVR